MEKKMCRDCKYCNRNVLEQPCLDCREESAWVSKEAKTIRKFAQEEKQFLKMLIDHDWRFECRHGATVLLWEPGREDEQNAHMSMEWDGLTLQCIQRVWITTIKELVKMLDECFLGKEVKVTAKGCYNCKYGLLPPLEEPCTDCSAWRIKGTSPDFSKWEARP